MSVLSDFSIRQQVEAGRLFISPFDANAVGPCSYDVTLGDEMKAVKCVGAYVNTMTGEGVETELVELHARGGWWLLPGRLYLGCTRERIGLPTDLVAQLHGRSTLARYGVVPHQEAGLIDAGWLGDITFEFTVVLPTMLFPGQPAGQLVFSRLTTPCERSYRETGRYQHSAGAVAPVPFGVGASPTPHREHGTAAEAVLSLLYGGA